LSVYVREGAYLLYVQGYCTSKPVYTLITPDRLRLEYNKGKKAYRTSRGNIEYYLLDIKEYVFKELLLKGERYPHLPTGEYKYVQTRYGSVDFEYEGVLSSIGCGNFTRQDLRKKNGVYFFYDLDKRKFPKDTVQVMLGNNKYHFWIDDFYLELSQLGLEKIKKEFKKISNT